MLDFMSHQSHANENYNEIPPLPPIRVAKIKKIKYQTLKRIGRVGTLANYRWECTLGPFWRTVCPCLLKLKIRIASDLPLNVF